MHIDKKDKSDLGVKEEPKNRFKSKRQAKIVRRKNFVIIFTQYETNL